MRWEGLCENGVMALFYVAMPFNPMLKYYKWKMNKWEKEGYDVSKLKEVLKR